MFVVFICRTLDGQTTVETFGPWSQAECAKRALVMRNQRRSEIAEGKFSVGYCPVRNERFIG